MEIGRLGGIASAVSMVLICANMVGATGFQVVLL